MSFLPALLACLALSPADGESTVAWPDGWCYVSPRPEIAPRFFSRELGGEFPGRGYALGAAARGSTAVDGRWIRGAEVRGGDHYLFRAEYLARDIAEPERSVLARVVWLDADGHRVEQPEYPLASPHRTKDGFSVLTGTYRAPAKAARAQLELHLRWTERGEVLWSEVALERTEPPEPRRVRLAAVNHRPRGTKSPRENLEQFARFLEEAAKERADVACLGEGITVVGTGKTYAGVAEPVPGPTTERLGREAARHRMWVVAGLYERAGDVVYNTSVLIDRKGRLAGKYRKVCLPREEIDGGITPGSEYPVFDTDFGRVAMMICWDVHFPEVARELSRRGAEVILMPIWGGNETLARARAIENQVHLVASGYDFRTAIFDRKGETLAAAEKDASGVIIAEVDLAERELWPWLGDWRARIWREAPPRIDQSAASAAAGTGGE